MSKGSRTWKIKTAVCTDSRWLLHLYLLCTAKYPIALPSFTSPFSGRSLPWLFKIICCTYGPKNGKHFFQERQKLMMHMRRQDEAHTVWTLTSSGDCSLSSPLYISFSESREIKAGFLPKCASAACPQLTVLQHQMSFQHTKQCSSL